MRQVSLPRLSVMTPVVVHLDAGWRFSFIFSRGGGRIPYLISEIPLLLHGFERGLGNGSAVSHLTWLHIFGTRRDYPIRLVGLGYQVFRVLSLLGQVTIATEVGIGLGL
jgi:hypothetical protein